MLSNGHGLHPPLSARRGSTIRVLGVARISTLNQDRLSLDDQRALYERWLADHTDLPWKMKMIATQASGERLDRDELKCIRRLVRKRKVDVIIAEDLGRVIRRVHAMIFCELCEDNGVRFIAINDHIDTFQENWRDQSFFAAFRHEHYNADTAKRIRRSLRNRFMQGGALRPLIFGYGLRPGGKTDADIFKFDWANQSTTSGFVNLKTVRPTQSLRIGATNTTFRFQTRR